jgi:signal transduction histidine kinase
VITAVLALAALAAFPWIVSARLASVRLATAESIAPARQLVRDIGTAVALEAAARDPSIAGSAPAMTSRYDQAVATERARDSVLTAVAPRLGDGLERDVEKLRTLIAQWHASPSGTAAGAGVSVTDVLAAVARLDAALAERQQEQNAHIRSLESVDVLLSSVLVPLLALALIAIYWTGRRMAALAAEAERSRLALVVASEHKVTMLRGLTHDLKNTLGAAAGFARLLREEVSGPLTTKQRHHVTRIERIIEQSIRAVEDALMVARTEAGAQPVRRHKEDVRVLLLESAADHVAAAERAGLTLLVEFAEDLPPVDTDPSLVSKIIGNLLSNAIKYTPAGGRIWLSASCRPGRERPETGSSVAIEVRDTGPGIPAALRERVFDEFFRAPAAATTAHGDGIGLAMSRRVARLLGGEITLESEEGRGATFTLWLPVQCRDSTSQEPSPPPGARPTGPDGDRISDADVQMTAEARRVAPPHPRAGGYDRRRAMQ